MGFAKTFISALFMSALSTAAAAQTDATRVASNVSESQKYVCASYWNPGPRTRICYEGSDNFTFGTFLPVSKNDLKVVVGNIKSNEEAGIYFNNTKGPLTFGVSAEYIDEVPSGEAHARINAGKNNKVFLAYGRISGTSTVTAADFFNIGRTHFGAGFSFRDRDIDKQLGIQMRGDHVRLYAAREQVAKFFYANDGNFQSLNGFVRVGNDYRPYRPAGLDADRFDFFQQGALHSRYWPYHPILPSQNTHLSEQGAFAVAPRFAKDKEKKTKVYGIDGFYTYKDFIGGYGFEHSRKADKKTTSHKISGGATIGPVRAVGSWDTERGFSVYGSITK